MKRIIWTVGLTAMLAAGALGATAMDDPYLWLEDVHGAKPLAWVAEQNVRTKGEIEADPRYAGDFATALAFMDAADRIPYGAFHRDAIYNFWQDASHPKGVWRRTTIADYRNPSPHWEILLDVDKLSADEKENWVWEGADCTPSRSRCLLSLSRGGGDAHVVREFDLQTRSFVADGFILAEAKSDATFVDDDTVLFGTDFGPGSMTASGYPRIARLWKRGGSVAAARILFEGQVSDIAAGGFAIKNADGVTPMLQRAPTFFTQEYYALKPDWTAARLPLPLGAVMQGLVRGKFLMTLRDDWTVAGKTFSKGSLLAMPYAPLAAGKVPEIHVLYAPGARESIEGVSTGDGVVYVSVYANVTGSIHVFRLAKDGSWSGKKLALPANGSTGLVSANDYGPEAAYTFESYLTPATLYFDDGANVPQPIKSLPARFDSSGLVTEQFEVASSDGVKIPYFVTRPKNLGGPAPTVLYGYGGFEVSQTPGYSANFGKLWLTRGGVYVVANIRGGGEFGPAWHQAALLENRQKAFDDFAAVAADLEKRGITTPKQLGIMGGSNGGLLVSTVMTQHPELLGAVVCQVPLIDMLRYTKIGAGASWAAEYGDPADPKVREWIARYSPYQNVRAGKKYPPVLFVTATSDDRVTPVHARKMAAKMEAQGHDVLFYENTDGGHSAAANHKQAAEMWALSFVYLKRKLGLD